MAVSPVQAVPHAVSRTTTGCERRWASWLPTPSLPVRSVAPLWGLLLGGLSAAIATVAFQELGLWAARRVGRQIEGASFIFLAAFLVRVIAGFGLFAVLEALRGRGTWFQDDEVFDIAGHWVSRIARGEGLSLFPAQSYFLDNLYAYSLAALYSLFGYQPLAPRAFNAALSALSAVLLADLARRAFQRPAVTRLVAAGAILLPSLVIWSLTTFKEPLVLVAGLVALRALHQALRVWPDRGAVATQLLVLAAASAVVNDLRHAAFLVLAAVALLALVGRILTNLRGRRALAAGATLLAFLVLVLAASRVWVPDSLLGRITQPAELAQALGDRRSTEAGADAPADAVALNTPADLARQLAFALFAPTPWSANGTFEAAAAVETLVWDGLLVGALFGWRTRPRDGIFVLVLGAYGLTTWLGLALTEGNVGNLIRHRTMLAPPLLLLGAAGLERAWRYRSGACQADASAGTSATG